ncbi:MAG: outer membrane protein assembly factor BamA [Candidatus Omnitrophica bacterium]|nr:outer membrane protein assembly factor BamA [Candidatus Omnitrophota bacterium]MCM8793112.1 outer membrane protein assembly factor BamA [Candidatus Omnitrophota bacterium]
MKKNFFIGGGFVLILFVQNPLFAEENQSRVISSIQIVGNVTVSSSTILSKIKSKAGQTFSQKELDEDLKRLYATGYFSDIKIDLRETSEGVMVIFNVQERPVIESISFEGNRLFRKEKLEKAVGSKVNDFLNPRQIKQDKEEIIRMYKDKGYIQVEVGEKIEVDPQTNYARVKFIINEKFRARIKKIKVEGNKSYPRGKILKLVKTKPAGIFRSGVFKPEVLEEDKERIKTFYQDAGYMDVEVESAVKYEKNWIYINFKIEEGKKYFANEINISGNTVYTREEIKKVLKMVQGKPFRQEGLRQDIIHIQELYFDKGYIQAEVDVKTELVEGTDKININYFIRENEVAYVERIDIRGNVRTKDVVVRRELRIYPGEQFEGKKLKRSRERLNNLGYFEEINFDIEPGSTANRKNLVVSVKEAKTGEFSFGGGYSSVDQFVGFVEITQRNFDLFNFPYFTGAGQFLKLRAQLGTVRQDYELSFTEPWIFGYPYSFGFDLYQKTRERERDIGYAFDERRRGGALRLGKEFTDYTRGDLIYRLDKIKISDISPEESFDLRQEEGDNTISAVLFRLTQDTRDYIFDPTRGYLVSGSIEGAGGPFGGDKDFLRYIAQGNLYFMPIEKIVLEMRLRAGIVDEFGDSDYVPVYERFFAGGAYTLRGFKERRVGPKDPNTGDPVGGEALLLGGVETTFPIVENIRGAVFYDFGNVWKEAGDFGSGGIKHSIGTGLRIKTPIGPIKLDFAYPLETEEGEKKAGRFHFSVGQRF